MMLTENPDRRPNIYQVLKESCALRGVEVPVKDVGRGHSKASQKQLTRSDLYEQNTLRSKKHAATASSRA